MAWQSIGRMSIWWLAQTILWCKSTVFLTCCARGPTPTQTQPTKKHQFPAIHNTWRSAVTNHSFTSIISRKAVTLIRWKWTRQTKRYWPGIPKNSSSLMLMTISVKALLIEDRKAISGSSVLHDFPKTSSKQVWIWRINFIIFRTEGWGKPRANLIKERAAAKRHLVSKTTQQKGRNLQKCLKKLVLTKSFQRSSPYSIPRSTRETCRK